MEINYNFFFKELSERTLKNYDYILRTCEQDNLYETTQLINSMYTLLVVPEEIFGIRHKNDMSEESAKKTFFGTREKNLKKHESYHKILDLINDLDKNNRIFYPNRDDYCNNYPVCCFIDSIRNSLCHDGIGFLPIQREYGGKTKNRIDDIIFESRDMSGQNVNFIAVISVEQLDKIVREVAALYTKVEDGKRNANQKEYCSFFEKLECDAKKYLPDWKKE